MALAREKGSSYNNPRVKRCRCSSMVERNLAKVNTRVRFPSLAPFEACPGYPGFSFAFLELLKILRVRFCNSREKTRGRHRDNGLRHYFSFQPSFKGVLSYRLAFSFSSSLVFSLCFVTFSLRYSTFFLAISAWAIDSLWTAIMEERASSLSFKDVSVKRRS